MQGAVNVNGTFGGNLEFKNSKPLHFVSRNTDLRVECSGPDHDGSAALRVSIWWGR
jgi:hypothetical protein